MYICRQVYHAMQVNPMNIPKTYSCGLFGISIIMYCSSVVSCKIEEYIECMYE